MLKKPTIILVDDHDLFRDGLKTLLELGNIATILGEAANGEEFLELLKDKKPDLVLIDIDMPVMNGIEATKQAIAQYPDLKIVALSMFGEFKYYSQMIDAGAKGFLLKSANKSELEKAITKVNNGRTYFSEDLLEDMMNNINNTKSSQKHSKNNIFSEKELEIIEHMAEGLSTEEIAEKVFLSAKTVSNYRNILLQKTGCKNSTHLIFFAIKNNLVSI